MQLTAIRMTVNAEHSLTQSACLGLCLCLCLCLCLGLCLCLSTIHSVCLYLSLSASS